MEGETRPLLGFGVVKRDVEELLLEAEMEAGLMCWAELFAVRKLFGICRQPKMEMMGTPRMFYELVLRLRVVEMGPERGPDVKVLDASWYIPDEKRTFREYQVARIPGALFFDVDGISDRASNLPHLLPKEEAFAATVSALRFDVETGASGDPILNASVASKAVEKVYKGQAAAPITFQTKYQPHLVWTLEQCLAVLFFVGGFCVGDLYSELGDKTWVCSDWDRAN
ncbi:hypothetical protein IFM89_009097 [Coptis chinensis]|uniref:Rhodanese domain-containing protein n=1 Tax=Coptis chinensis TaxID=261450 RepID=A0A835IKZ9_9MAGN|nr:hypothetical protein IFM89_009097 [Coptis chinensis]